VLITPPSSDTYINQAATTTNYGSATELGIANSWAEAAWSQHPLLAFDISALTGKSVGLARLVMRISSLGNALTAGINEASWMRLEARRLRLAFVAGQATWNIWSTGNNWTTAGARSDGNDVDTEKYAGLLVTNLIAGSPLVLDITGLVRDALAAGDTTLRLILGGHTGKTGGQNPYGIYSVDHATTAYRPSLQVIYG
jgi:hypothetical protein